MMEENPEQHFTLEQLAKFCKMSIPAYTQKFRSTLGLSPMQYLQKIRLFQVQHYLAATGLSIGEIAELTGFCTANLSDQDFSPGTRHYAGPIPESAAEPAGKIADRYIISINSLFALQLFYGILSIDNLRFAT